MKNKLPYIRFFLMIFSFVSEGFTSISDKKAKIKHSNFPIPYPLGGKMITDRWDGNSGHRTLRYDGEHHASLRSFYDTYASASDWKHTKSRQQAGLSVIYSNPCKGYTINLAPPNDQIINGVLVTLHVAG